MYVHPRVTNVHNFSSISMPIVVIDQKSGTNLEKMVRAGKRAGRAIEMEMLNQQTGWSAFRSALQNAIMFQKQVRPSELVAMVPPILDR